MGNAFPPGKLRMKCEQNSYGQQSKDKTYNEELTENLILSRKWITHNIVCVKKPIESLA